MIIRKFLGWELASSEDYKSCYQQYGGNFSTHPDVLSYIHNQTHCAEKYFVHHRSGIIDGAVCVWNNTLANDLSTDSVTSHLYLPVAKDELILPITRNHRLIMPFRSKIISPINKNIINRNEFFNSNRTICLAKPVHAFSKRTAKKRIRELNHFLNSGGEIRNQSDFSASDMFEIYHSLFEMRRGKQKYDKALLLNFIENFRENFYGKILFMNNTPCAFMMITRCESHKTIALDYINIGINKEIKEHSLGSILMWVNINDAYTNMTNEDKEVRFSFGRPSSEYKNMWCFKEKVGRLL